LGFVFTCNDGSATIGVVVFVTESSGHVKKTPEQEAMERGFIQEEIFQ
jgi:hypothetical protein